MSSRFLPIIVENASFVLAKMVPILQRRDVGGDRVLKFCTQFRRRGIASMLQKADASALHRDLQRSGAAYAWFLGWSKEDDKTASKAMPFFDAVACGDHAMARLIAQTVAQATHTDQEYEDDFLYMRWLMGRFFPRHGTVGLGGMLVRYEEILNGDEDPRFRVCQALDTTDAALFDSALRAMIELRDEDYANGIEADRIVEEEWATEGKVFVEALALIRLAAGLGVNVESDYMYVPSLALGTSAASFDPGSWRHPSAL